jgi:hypothetical protein
MAAKTRKIAERRGVTVRDARRIVLDLGNVVEGLSYGQPSFLVNGRFFARFRDEETVLVLQLSSIDDRELLMQIDSEAFFFTDHYRNYPAVLIRLADVPRPLFEEVVRKAWQHASTRSPAKARSKRRR